MTRLLAVALALVFAGGQAPNPGEAQIRQQLLGNWKLVKDELFDQGGAAGPGAYVAGRVVYDASGEMSAHLMRSVGRQEQPRTESAQAAAYQTYIGYFGPFTVDARKGTVTHHVIGSSYPHWIGSEQVRYYGFSTDGSQLTLSLKTGDRITRTLTWTRVR
jgi:hypothetical protein